MQLLNAQIQRTRHSLIYLLTLFPVPCQNNVTTASSDGVPAAKTSLSSSDHNDIDINHLLSPPPPSTPPPLQRFLSPVKRLQGRSSAVSWCLLSSRQSPWNFGVKILLAGAGARAHSYNTQLPLKTWRGRGGVGGSTSAAPHHDIHILTEFLQLSRVTLGCPPQLPASGNWVRSLIEN